MIADKIKELREQAEISQSQLAKKLRVTRSSVNAWEMGLSTPTTQYVVDLARLFHVTADCILGIEAKQSLVLDGYSREETELVYSLIHYIDSRQAEPD